MKKIFLAIVIVLSSIFAASAAKEPITDESKVAEVMTVVYPHLTEYFAEGVLEIASLTEETLLDGDVEYNIKYRFVNCRYDEDELNSYLLNNDRRLYRLKRIGILDVSALKYVDEETGEIKTKVLCNRNARRMRR